MPVSFYNSTEETLVLCCRGTSTNARDDHHLLLPGLSTTRNGPRRFSRMSITLISSKEFGNKKPGAGCVKVQGITFVVSGRLRGQWQTVKVPEDSPWRIYCFKHARKSHRVLILPQRDTFSFLSDIPDTTPLYSLCLPGTHETMAFFGWPVSQCQSPSNPLSMQLHDGIRVIDIRLSIVDGRLISYHGLWPERAPFKEILSTIYTFLDAPESCRETLVMSIKQEDEDSKLFSQLVREEITASEGGLSRWYLENRIPTLGEVRGKVVMFSRFGDDGFGWENAAIGIHPPLWPDSAREGFTWECQDTLVRTHDWYAITTFLSIPEKTHSSTNILISSREDASIPTLSIAFFSASSFPLALPPTVARGFGWPKIGLGVEGVNDRVGKWLLESLSDESVSGEKYNRSEPRIRGWTLMDYYNEPAAEGIVPLLVECNFRGRCSGEEGWP